MFIPSLFILNLYIIVVVYKHSFSFLFSPLINHYIKCPQICRNSILNPFMGKVTKGNMALFKMKSTKVQHPIQSLVIIKRRQSG